MSLPCLCLVSCSHHNLHLEAMKYLLHRQKLGCPFYFKLNTCILHGPLWFMKMEKKQCKKCKHFLLFECFKNNKKGKLRKCCVKCLDNEKMYKESPIYIALKKDKEMGSIEYLGCNIETFKQHIEQQFTEGMPWKNYGEWHIYHKVPLKYNKPSLEKVVQRLHYTNTHPIWAIENMSKGCRYISSDLFPSFDCLE